MAELKERESKSLGRWDPFADLDLFEGWSPLWEFEGPRSMLRRLFEEWPRPQRFAPAMDLHESGEAYVVTVEIPGAGRDDVTVEIDQGLLSISGEKKSERDEKEESRRYVERSFGAFRRSFRLPSNAQSDKVDASYKDGFLTITIPKTEESKPRVVSLK